MRPETTYELKITFICENPTRTKDQLKAFLQENEIFEFVEGALDVDINHDYDSSDIELFELSGGNEAPLSIFKYDRDFLSSLRDRLQKSFNNSIKMEIKELATTLWTEGWKESFKPIFTEKFCVHPPWDKPKSINKNYISIEIDPGMAFGTGQHETTQLCLQAIETVVPPLLTNNADLTLADVGCGSGILAIAAKKIGINQLVATDIDLDAVASAQSNAKVNGVEYHCFKGSTPTTGPFDIVVANILAVVIRKIFTDLVSACKNNGRLIISGILSEEAKELETIAKNHNLTLEHKSEQNNWCCFVFRRNN